MTVSELRDLIVDMHSDLRTDLDRLKQQRIAISGVLSQMNDDIGSLTSRLIEIEDWLETTKQPAETDEFKLAKRQAEEVQLQNLEGA